MTSEQIAAEFLHKYGNVGRNAEDLLKYKPTDIELAAARLRCEAYVHRIIEVIKEYHTGTHFPIEIRLGDELLKLVEKPEDLPTGIPFTITRTPERRIKMYYFGCMSGSSGHYLYDVKRGRVYEDNLPNNFPCKISVLDGGLFPLYRYRIEGDAYLNHVNGWTILSFLDCSGDSRPGSCSTFVVEGIHDFETMRVLTREAFPTIWSRFKYEVNCRS